ncbi:MAG: hypothetical protein JEZ03_06695 [Bacteroidales bacterium]|nr:hypothetical protein [Bacteroidales bacterium]
MNIPTYHKTLNAIIELAKINKTGTPIELSAKLSISERTLRRMLNDIRLMEINIKYSRKEQTYKIFK